MSKPTSPASLFDLKREMGYSLRVFLEQVPAALSDYEFEVLPGRVSVKLGKGHALLLLGEERERRFTEHVSFPVLPVTIDFVDVDTDEQELFMQRFDRSYMKGLG